MILHARHGSYAMDNHYETYGRKKFFNLDIFVPLQSAHTKFDPVLYKQKYVREQAENSRYETLLNHQAMWTNAC